MILSEMFFTVIGWIPSKFSTDIHVPFKMNCDHFGDPSSFHPPEKYNNTKNNTSLLNVSANLLLLCNMTTLLLCLANSNHFGKVKGTLRSRLNLDKINADLKHEMGYTDFFNWL